MMVLEPREALGLPWLGDEQEEAVVEGGGGGEEVQAMLHDLHQVGGRGGPDPGEG